MDEENKPDVSEFDNIRNYTDVDAFKPDGETVLFIRKDMFYPVTLSGLKPTVEECADHAERNPGTLRIESLDGTTIYWTEGTQH